MNKNLLLVLCLVCTANFATAQSQFGPISLNYGEKIEKSKDKIVRIAGEANGKIYSLSVKGKNHFIKVFNSDGMTLESTNLIDLSEFKGKDVDFDDLAVVNQKIYVLGSVYDKKAKEANLIGFEVGVDGNLTGIKRNLFSTSVTKKSERGQFYFKDSPSGEKLLIMHAAFFDKKETIQYELKLLDENLNVEASHLEKVLFEDRKGLEFTISDFDVNTNDDIFLAINESYRDKKAKQNIEKFEVHAFKKANKYAKEVVKIDFTGKEVINCQMLANQSGQLQLVGFYSSVRKNGKPNKELKGVYATVVNTATNKVDNLKFNEFDYDTKVKLLGERRAKKGKDVKPLYVPHSIIEKDDGGIILLSEYRLVVVGKSQGFGPLSMTPITHINNEIIVTSIGKDGTVEWTNVIAKNQKASFTSLSLGLFTQGGNASFAVTASVDIRIAVLGKGPEYLGAIPIYENGELTVVFNDNMKNVGVTDIEEIKALGNYNKAVPTAFIFDNKTGEINRVDSEAYKDGQLILRPGIYYRKNASEYLIYASRKSEDRLGRMAIANKEALAGRN